MSFTKNLGKNTSKNLSCEHSQKFFDHAKHFATDALKTASKRPIQKAAETIDDLIGNKIADKINVKMNFIKIKDFLLHLKPTEE